MDEIKLKQHHRGKPRTRSRPGAGRPTKYTPELGAEICETLRLGCPITTTAAYHRLDPATLQNWINRGYDGDPEYEEFAWNADRARSGFIRDNLALIAKAAKGSKESKPQFFAAAWLCERCVEGQPYAIQRHKVEVTADCTVKEAAIAQAETKAIEGLEARFAIEFVEGAGQDDHVVG